MSLVLVLVGLVLLALPGLTSGRRLDPSVWARAVGTSLVAGLWVTRAGLLLTAVPAAIEVLGVHPVAHACHHFLGATADAWVAVGWLGASALVALELRGRAAHRRVRAAQRRARIEAWLGVHELVDATDVVTLEADEPLAYSVDGRPDQVVLTTALRRTLTEDELAAVVDHELAHLRNRHLRALRRAARIEGALGWLRPVRRSIRSQRLAVERLADEEAAISRGRPVVRSALAKLAERARLPLPAFAMSTTAPTVSDRLAALDDRRPGTGTLERSAVVAVPMVVAGVLTSTALLAASGHHGFAGLLSLCGVDVAA